ncbi:MAG: rhomboid family intramembrane serine protease [Rhodoblastus sp.]
MVLIPLGDDAPHARRDTPYVTYALIALNVAIFIWRQTVSHGEDIVFERHWGVTPALMFGTKELGIVERFYPLFTYMFLHGGWAHLIGNMLFLWIFGDDIEDALGHGRFVAFYLLCGAFGALLYCVFTKHPQAPLVGASGAIAGVMGAYLMIRPCAHVRVLVFIKIVAIRAMYVILAWAALQIWHVITPADGVVAWWAHIGGMLAGAALIPLMRQPGVQLWECIQQRTFVSPWDTDLRPPSARDARSKF